MKSLFILHTPVHTCTPPQYPTGCCFTMIGLSRSPPNEHVGLIAQDQSISHQVHKQDPHQVHKQDRMRSNLPLLPVLKKLSSVHTEADFINLSRSDHLILWGGGSIFVYQNIILFAQIETDILFCAIRLLSHFIMHVCI